MLRGTRKVKHVNSELMALRPRHDYCVGGYNAIAQIKTHVRGRYVAQVCGGSA